MRRAALFSIVLAACGSSYADGTGKTAPVDGGTEAGAPLCTGGAIHVSPSKGDDLHDGCDPAKPKKTLNSALGQVQAKNAAGTEIRTCVETLRERVVVAYPASIIGGFDCTTWAPGPADAKTTIEAPSDAIEALIAFGAPVDGKTRLERLRFVGATRAQGPVTALRFKEGASPVVRSFAVAGGSTQEGIALAVAIEGASPTLEDGVIEGGTARCTVGCTSVVASGITINGGNPRLRRLRITGGTADVVPTGNYVGAVTVDVVGPAKAVDADGFSELEIVHGVGRVGSSQPSWGMRILDAEIDLVDSKVLPAEATSTCVSTTCASFGFFASGTTTARVRRSRIVTTEIAGAPGTAGTKLDAYGVYASEGAKLEVASSFVHATTAAVGAQGASVSLLGSTLLGPGLIANDGGNVDVNSSILGNTKKEALGLYASSCVKPSKTAFASSAIIGSPTSFGDLLVTAQGADCTGSGGLSSLSAMVARSDTNNTFTAVNMVRVAASCTDESGVPCFAPSSCSDTAACLGEIFASIAPLDGFMLKDQVRCAISQGGSDSIAGFLDATKKTRSSPFAMGAHEYDGACTN